jgi:hypothetical protein
VEPRLLSSFTKFGMTHGMRRVPCLVVGSVDYLTLSSA